MVSILVPNFNKAQLLRETLDSILAQTYTNWECVIVDDHSTDNSWEILEEYAGLDSRFKIFKRPIERKKGGNAARNFAFENSKGDYIQWLDSDDLIHPNKISEQVSEFLTSDTKLVSISNWKWIDSSAEIDHESPNSKNIPNLESRWAQYPVEGLDLILWLFQNKFFIPIHSYLVRAELLRQSGLWNEDLIQNQDGEFMVRVLLKSKKISYHDSVYTYYRRPNLNHLSQQTTYRSWRDWFESYVLCDNLILGINDTKKTKQVLSFNYERLIRLIALDYPDIAQLALERIRFLDPFVRFDHSKPLIIMIGSWIGIKNFLILRNYLIQYKLMKV
jgi:glycosyltransferase involved in cell wall biosynthesis